MGLPQWRDTYPDKKTAAKPKTKTDPTAAARSSIRRRPSIHRGSYPRAPEPRAHRNASRPQLRVDQRLPIATEARTTSLSRGSRGDSSGPSSGLQGLAGSQQDQHQRNLTQQRALLREQQQVLRQQSSLLRRLQRRPNYPLPGQSRFHDDGTVHRDTSGTQHTSGNPQDVARRNAWRREAVRRARGASGLDQRSSAARQRGRIEADTVANDNRRAILPTPPLESEGLQSASSPMAENELESNSGYGFTFDEFVAVTDSIDGLGDRITSPGPIQRMQSPEAMGEEDSRDTWEIFSSTMTPDATVPSNSTSFASTGSTGTYNTDMEYEETSRRRVIEDSDDSNSVAADHLRDPDNADQMGLLEGECLDYSDEDSDAISEAEVAHINNLRSEMEATRTRLEASTAEMEDSRAEIEAYRDRMRNEGRELDPRLDRLLDAVIRTDVSDLSFRPEDLENEDQSSIDTDDDDEEDDEDARRRTVEHLNARVDELAELRRTLNIPNGTDRASVVRTSGNPGISASDAMARTQGADEPGRPDPSRHSTRLRERTTDLQRRLHTFFGAVADEEQRANQEPQSRSTPTVDASTSTETPVLVPSRDTQRHQYSFGPAPRLISNPYQGRRRTTQPQNDSSHHPHHTPTQVSESRRAMRDSAAVLSRMTDALSRDGSDLDQMRGILERLARREDIPDEWWMSAGLSRNAVMRGRDASASASAFAGGDYDEAREVGRRRTEVDGREADEGEEEGFVPTIYL